MSSKKAIAPLVRAASAYYRAAGRFAWHFARAKLAADPAFPLLLQQGLLQGRARLLDLGAGQGLLAAWLLAAHSLHGSERAGEWPRGWPAPPQLQSYLGIEINPQEVRRARSAFALDPGIHLQLVHGDIRDVDYGAPDAIVILDVLHYLDHAAQERVLQRVRAALQPQGVLLMRIGDAAGGLAFALSNTVDHAVALLRRGRWMSLTCRTLPQWEGLLRQLNFSTRSLPLSQGTPFANFMLIAHPR